MKGSHFAGLIRKFAVLLILNRHNTQKGEKQPNRKKAAQKGKKQHGLLVGLSSAVGNGRLSFLGSCVEKTVRRKSSCCRKAAMMTQSPVQGRPNDRPTFRVDSWEYESFDSFRVPEIILL